MKKSLWFINLLALLLVFGSCKNQGNQDPTSKTDLRIHPSDSATADTTRIDGNAIGVGSVGADGGVPKDSVHVSPNGHPHIPGSPDQAKLDSIKDAKKKSK